MDRMDYYEALADKIVFSGLRSDEVEQFASYKPGKDYQDLVKAVTRAKQEAAGRSAEALFDGIAVEVSRVLDIDTKEPLGDFEIRLKSAV